MTLATNSGSHQVSLNGVVGLSLARSMRRNSRRQRAGWVGAGIVVGGITLALMTQDSFEGFIALLFSPVTVPTGAAVGTLVSAAFLEGKQVEPRYLIDEGHYQIEVVRP